MFESEQIKKQLLSDEKANMELLISRSENKNNSLIEKINEFEITKTTYFEIFNLVKTFISKCRCLFENVDHRNKIGAILNMEIMEDPSKEAFDDIIVKFQQVVNENKRIQGTLKIFIF